MSIEWNALLTGISRSTSLPQGTLGLEVYQKWCIIIGALPKAGDAVALDWRCVSVDPSDSQKPDGLFLLYILPLFFISFAQNTDNAIAMPIVAAMVTTWEKATP